MGLLPALFFVSILSTYYILPVYEIIVLCTIQTLVASVLLRQIHYHVFKFLGEFIVIAL